MEELKLTGIVLSSIDYKDNDKLVNIFSLELGKITALLKGVKKDKAKLKFASQPFCFSEFVLIKKGEFYIVIEANQLASFYDLTSDYDRCMVGGKLLKICNSILKPNILADDLFFNLIKTLKILIYEKTDEQIILLKYLLTVFEMCGYEINLERCRECDCVFNSNIMLNLEGFLTCKNCAYPNSVEITRAQFNTLKIVKNCNLEKLHTVKICVDFIIDLNKCLQDVFNHLLLN